MPPSSSSPSTPAKIRGEAQNGPSWLELEGASERDWETGGALARAIDLWCREHDVSAAALYAPSDEGAWELVQASTAGPPPPAVGAAAGERALSIGGGFRFVYRPSAATAELESLGGFGFVLAAAARLQRMHTRLREQIFQENYKVVTLEALYDVGLHIASTLNLEQLSEEILLRAVSLLDARRGALYRLVGDALVLERTIGGDALPQIARSHPMVRALLSREQTSAPELLPGALHTLAVPIEVETTTQGVLVVADKESRTGVGPFVDGDVRALSMFANQAAIALENARLHRQALEQERLERELELAAEIQRGILPREMPQLASVELAGWNRPTHQVGGDYYGSLRLGDSRTGIVVADVTGKGMPAALLVSTLHSALHLLLDHVEPGAGLVSRLSQHIWESSQSNKFITMILVIVDHSGDELGFVNAGHNPGLLVRAQGPAEHLSASGLPLGLMPGSDYRLDKVRFEPGDLLCLYSDGITECESPQAQEYGCDRLADFLAARREWALPAILADLDAEVTAFASGRPQGDDQTVVLLRRRPHSGGPEPLASECAG